jgi:formate hydrogenlyase transcriptional activator
MPDSLDRPSGKDLERRGYQALLEMADLMVYHRDLPDLLREMGTRLHDLCGVHFVHFSLYDPARDVMRVYVSDGTTLQPVLEHPASRAIAGQAWRTQEPVLIRRIESEACCAALGEILASHNVKSYCVLPLSTSNCRLGGLGLGSTEEDAFEDSELPLLQRFAHMAALVVENAFTARALEQEKSRLHSLTELTQVLASSHPVSENFPRVAESMSRMLAFDFAGIALYDPDADAMRVRTYFGADGLHLLTQRQPVSMQESFSAQAFRSGTPQNFDRRRLQELDSDFANRMLAAGVQTVCSLPLAAGRFVFGALNVGRRDPSPYSAQEQSLLSQIAAQLALAVENARAFLEIEVLKDKLEEEKVPPQDFHCLGNFDEIIGQSAALKRVLLDVQTVSGSGATVLITGETGTGKELIARAIHRLSHRSDKNFIKVNCAAIPTGLLESELFGHEKGAFTGAISQKIGRLELADQGTIFLDEVGEIPLEVQPKLLRVLQDQEFERLGSTRTVRVDLRIVAATNRDLQKSMDDGFFRQDLYYRLNVFPIQVPALRDRTEDIPPLVHYFVRNFANRMGKQVDAIPRETLDVLVKWHWPGNVRELENLIERSVILTEGNSLRVPLSELGAGNAPGTGRNPIEALERDLIIRMLRETRGIIGGPSGAAARLGLKRTTLQSKMVRLGIQPKRL